MIILGARWCDALSRLHLWRAASTAVARWSQEPTKSRILGQSKREGIGAARLPSRGRPEGVDAGENAKSPSRPSRALAAAASAPPPRRLRSKPGSRVSGVASSACACAPAGWQSYPRVQQPRGSYPMAWGSGTKMQIKNAGKIFYLRYPRNMIIK